MENDYEVKKAELTAEIARKLPEFYNLVKEAQGGKKHGAVLHQDAFAADYQDEEYVLLGKAIKYAGIHGVQIVIHGKNGETLKS